MTKKRFWRGSVMCWACKYHNEKNPFICEAFPDGIPHVIISNEVDHFAPLKGQPNDLAYELKEKKKKVGENK